MSKRKLSTTVFELTPVQRLSVLNKVMEGAKMEFLECLLRGDFKNGEVEELQGPGIVAPTMQGDLCYLGVLTDQEYSIVVEAHGFRTKVLQQWSEDQVREWLRGVEMKIFPYERNDVLQDIARLELVRRQDPLRVLSIASMGRMKPIEIVDEVVDFDAPEVVQSQPAFSILDLESYVPEDPFKEMKAICQVELCRQLAKLPLADTLEDQERNVVRWMSALYAESPMIMLKEVFAKLDVLQRNLAMLEAAKEGARHGPVIQVNPDVSYVNLHFERLEVELGMRDKNSSGAYTDEQREQRAQQVYIRLRASHVWPGVPYWSVGATTPTVFRKKETDPFVPWFPLTTGTLTQWEQEMGVSPVPLQYAMQQKVVTSEVRITKECAGKPPVVMAVTLPPVVTQEKVAIPLSQARAIQGQWFPPYSVTVVRAPDPISGIALRNAVSQVPLKDVRGPGERLSEWGHPESCGCLAVCRGERRTRASVCATQEVMYCMSSMFLETWTIRQVMYLMRAYVEWKPYMEEMSTMQRVSVTKSRMKSIQNSPIARRVPALVMMRVFYYERERMEDITYHKPGVNVYVAINVSDDGSMCARVNTGIPAAYWPTGETAGRVVTKVIGAGPHRLIDHCVPPLDALQWTVFRITPGQKHDHKVFVSVYDRTRVYGYVKLPVAGIPQDYGCSDIARAEKGGIVNLSPGVPCGMIYYCFPGNVRKNMEPASVMSTYVESVDRWRTEVFRV